MRASSAVTALPPEATAPRIASGTNPGVASRCASASTRATTITRAASSMESPTWFHRSMASSPPPGNSGSPVPCASACRAIGSDPITTCSPSSSSGTVTVPVNFRVTARTNGTPSTGTCSTFSYGRWWCSRAQRARSDQGE